MKNTPAAAGTGEATIAQEQPRARVPHVTDPADASPVRLDTDWRPASNDGGLTSVPQHDATSRAMDCLKQGFRDSLSPFSEEEAQRIDAAMLADKKRNRYDSRREEQAAQVEADQRRARGEA